MKTAILTVAALPLVASVAFAAPPVSGSMNKSHRGAMHNNGMHKKMNMPSFSKLDKNHSGYLSKTELNKAPEMMSHWQKMDTNNDGKISRSEYMAFKRQQGGGMSKSPGK